MTIRGSDRVFRFGYFGLHFTKPWRDIFVVRSIPETLAGLRLGYSVTKLPSYRLCISVPASLLYNPGRENLNADPGFQRVANRVATECFASRARRLFLAGHPDNEFGHV